MKINQFVVVYLDVDEISRPTAPLDVSPCTGILSSYSFFFLGTPQDYAMRPYSCWCNTCSRVRGRGYGTVMGWWETLEVPGCACSLEAHSVEGGALYCGAKSRHFKARSANG